MLWLFTGITVLAGASFGYHHLSTVYAQEESEKENTETGNKNTEDTEVENKEAEKEGR